MVNMNNVDYKIFTTIARMNEKQMLKSMKSFLQKYYPPQKINVTSHYILCEGTSPIMLVAHLDTFFKIPPKNIYYDKGQHTMWSPQGLGADDRAGIFAIIKILQHSFLPHICLTTGEEAGGVGANVLIAKYPKPPFDIKYIVELDRQGIQDAVFYYCDNPKFKDYIESCNFISDWGTFTDISIICPVWKIAGVNLSVGYFNEHSKIETLHTDILYATIKKVEQMIQHSKNAPYFKYIPMEYQNYLDKILDEQNNFQADTFSQNADGVNMCAKCKQYFFADDFIPVRSSPDNTIIKNYCIDCANNCINWCENCGEAFESDDIMQAYCQNCQNKIFSCGGKNKI